jgi:hypothetical protein
MLAMILNICNPYDFPQTPEQDVKVEKLEWDNDGRQLNATQ